MAARTTGQQRGRHLAISSLEQRGRGVKVALRSLVTAVVAAVAFAGLVALPASAADNITFRASAQAAANQITHRVTIPAAVRDTDGLLLFVTSNRALGTVVATPAGWTRVGNQLSSTDTETILYSKVATATDAGRSQAVDFTATTKASLVLLAYDGTDPTTSFVERFASAAETTNRATHSTPGLERHAPSVRTSSRTGPTSRPRRPAGPSPPARPSARCRSVPAPAASPRWPPT